MFVHRIRNALSARRYASFMNDIACDLQIQRNAFLIKETSSSGPVVGAECLCMSN
jgi:hypothetical protein